MKKRIIEKKSKKELKTNLLDELRSCGLKLSYIKYLSGYYFFHFGKNKVLHFKIEGINDILFALWNTNGYYEIFGEVETYINKFKPSNCNLSFETIDELIDFSKKLLNNYNREFVKILRKHYFDHFNECGYEMSDKRILEEYAKEKEDRNAEKKNNGMTLDEIAIRKKHFDELIKLCDSYDLTVFKMKKCIFYYMYCSIFIVSHLGKNLLPKEIVDYIKSNGLMDEMSITAITKKKARELNKKYSREWERIN